MAEETVSSNSESSGKRKRRRRRRRRNEEEKGSRRLQQLDDEVLLLDDGPQPHTATASKRRGRNEQPVSVPASGRNPYRVRGSRPKRKAPGSAAARRRRLSRAQMDDIADWLKRAPEQLVSTIYRGLGGQPSRVANTERMIQLSVRALAQPNRIGTLLKQMSEKDRKALSALMQCGGIAHASEFHRELALSLGGHEREWKKVCMHLANRGVVLASREEDGQFFYIVPEPLMPGLSRR